MSRKRWRARNLFSILSPDIIELAPTEADLAKLFTNSWRNLNSAISSQFYVLAQSYGLDFYRIDVVVIRNDCRMAGFSRARFAAGPCLLKDTLRRDMFLTQSNGNSLLGHERVSIDEVRQVRLPPISNRIARVLAGINVEDIYGERL